MPATYDPMLVAIRAPGAFITLGFLMAILNLVKEKK
jgi:Na+-translocating ferredoxin:NAD+ oxidoreductase RnfE subunit